MDQIDEPIRHRVVVDPFGDDVATAKARTSSYGLDPDSPAGVLVGMLEAGHSDWEAVVTFEVGSAGAVPVGVEVRSAIGQPLTRAVWDRVRLAEVIRDAQELVEWLAPLRPGRPKLPEPRKRRSPGRPREYPDQHYRRVAAVYLAAPKSPVRAVARAFVGEYPGLTDPHDKRARSWVRTARRLGFIPDAHTVEEEQA